MMVKRAVICADGACQGNPGLAAIGAVIEDGEGKLLTAISRPIGRTTNNEAEYRAVIAALEEALRLGVSEVDICLDSELLVRQINGTYRIKSAKLKPLYQYVKQLLNFLDAYTVTHIPREQNREADRLANKALSDFTA